MLRSSPLAKAGFRILAASMAPSLLPAPTKVWISSMKRIISPCACVTSLMTLLSRSSNSPLYFAPATSAPMSSEYSFLFFRFSGTSPRTMRCAKPSTMAVLPVPGSPMRIGLFLVRRERICSTRRISSSRPITGSSLPSRASSTRLRAYFCSAWYVSSLDCDVAFCPPRSSRMAFFRPSAVTPASLSICAAKPPSCSRACKSGSRPTYVSPDWRAISTAFWSTRFASLSK